MRKYIDINQVKEEITEDDIYNILDYLGAMPRYESNCITSLSICHDSNSRKLFYYPDSQLFHCFVENETFDIVGLIEKLLIDCGNEEEYQSLLNMKKPHLADTLTWINEFCGLSCSEYSKQELSEKHVPQYATSKKLEDIPSIVVGTYDINLTHYPRPIIEPWAREGISDDVCNEFGICYDPVQGSILIPHYTKEGKCAGIKQRTLVQDEDGEPIFCANGDCIRTKYLNYWNGVKLNKSTSLYGIHKHKGQSKAILFESEKSVLKCYSMFGMNNYLPLATNGRSLSVEQAKILYDCGITELTIAFDRDYTSTGEDEFSELLYCYARIQEQFCNYFDLYYIVDSNDLLQKHDAPIDEGKEVFIKLFKERTRR